MYWGVQKRVLSIVVWGQLSGKINIVIIFFTFLLLQRFDTDSSLWRARSIEHPNFLATSETNVKAMLLGTNDWTIYNDSLSCSDSGAYTRDKEYVTGFDFVRHCLPFHKSPPNYNAKSLVWKSLYFFKRKQKLWDNLFYRRYNNFLLGLICP